MSLWEDQSFNEGEITDLDTARLALRGAIASLRSLQDINLTQKAELQELIVREKGWKQRIAEMEARLAELHGKWQSSPWWQGMPPQMGRSSMAFYPMCPSILLGTFLILTTQQTVPLVSRLPSFDESGSSVCRGAPMCLREPRRPWRHLDGS